MTASPHTPAGGDDFSRRLHDALSTPDDASTPPAPTQSGTEAQAETGETAGPAGQGDYVVRAGDCISSIAKETGHLWETIWDDSANAELRRVRQDPNVLMEGDRVTIPELRRKEEPGEAERRHRFIRRGEPAHLKLQVLDDDRPVANQPYELWIDGQTQRGTTDPEGKLDIPIPPNAKRAKLKVGTAPNDFEYDLELGATEPVEDLKGVQQRLRNLGFRAVPIDGDPGSETAEALRAFQKLNNLPETGEADGATRQKLKQKHGS